MFTLRILAITSLVMASLAVAGATEPKKGPSLIERLLNPDRGTKSPYEGKSFNPGGNFSGKPFTTHEYEGTKNFESKLYSTGEYQGSRQSWMGKLLFPEKKLPENLQGVSRDSSKEFASKDLAMKNYAEADKKSGDSGDSAYQDKKFSMKGKTQGAIDNDPKLQEAIKKGLSIDDVRNLLNKAP